MAKNAAITVRIPSRLKKRIAARAKRERRSVSAQVEHELERAFAEEEVLDPGPSVLGMFPGPVPTDDDFAEVRRRLWSRLSPDRNA